MSAKKLDYFQRTDPRKNVSDLLIEDLTCLNNYGVLAQKAMVVDVGMRGLRIRVLRKDLEKSLRHTFNLDAFLGESVVLFIPDMDLDVDAIIMRTKSVDKNSFDLFLGYSAHTPDYWKQCFLDMFGV